MSDENLRYFEAFPNWLRSLAEDAVALAGILAAVWIFGRRWVAWGGDWDLIMRCAMWGVGAGVVGARLYHVAGAWR